MEADPVTGRAIASTDSSIQSDRDRRYRELLRSAPPAAPSQPAPAPSLLQRVVAPIASALGIGSPKPAASAAAPRTQPPGQQISQTHSSGSSGSGQEKPKTPPADPDSDVTAPRLFGAEFAPQQVEDGQQTVFTTMVNDDLSGVRLVSGVVGSPSGSVQGFTCQREGETNHYVARITIPKDAAEGLWIVRYLTLSDNAGNSVNLNAAQGGLPPSASFHVVSSNADSTGPTLKAVWLDKVAMQAGEKNTVFVQAEDDKSGVSMVSGVFVSPSKAARLGFGCAQRNGMWECALTPPGCLDCGAWHLEQLQIQDKANNVTTARADNALVSAVVVDIRGDSCDSAPPALTSLTLNPMRVSNSADSVIQVQAIVSDDACGVASLSGQAAGPANSNGARLYFSFDPSKDGQVFNGRINVPQHAAKGVWTISWLQVLDNGHNLKSYPANDPVIARVTFVVE